MDSAAFARLGPAAAVTPLVCAVPHAGRDYPPALLADAAVPRHVLEELEDRHADRLVRQAVADGAVAIVARLARAWIDLNRGEEDLDPALRSGLDSRPASARARSGLGLIPRRVGRRDLWRHPPDPAEAARRIDEAHRPYHQAIAQALAEARARHGFAVLLDCHSMPPLAERSPPRIVIGDRHGITAARQVVDALLAEARATGHRTALNAPYAGAYAIMRHGRPAGSIHAVQIEIDRSLYLDRELRNLAAGVEPMAGLIAALGQAAVLAAQNHPPLAIAAE